ncbi:DJ-1/PfpI family protein [Alteromonas ponticola]|uniref:DJ-1/PfpI family protein n=1 Tax=Alteromonas ponticola TaxID=2720613 RepID=A0ABX1R3I2_9ALTE|nr:DJ-1/PfpI family protein [Alteromonas ponticola]NMH60211.1 DJ-1/PfpI family protein [Alteromonas ponticola]
MKKKLMFMCTLLLVLTKTSLTHASEQTTVGVLLFDGVQIIDFTGPWEVFGQARFEVKTVSSQGQQITTTMGMKVTPDYSYQAAPVFDILLVPGGHVQNAKSAEHIDWIRKHVNAANMTLSVCNGALLLAETGVLKDKEATTFFHALDDLEEDYEDIKVRSDVRYTHSDNIITSAGLSSGIDASLYVVSQRLGVQKAKEIAMHMEYDWDPDAGFVRGLMADKYLPDLKINFDQSIPFTADRVYHYGDKQEWQQHYRIATDASIAQVTSQVKEQIANQGWHYQAQTDSWKKILNEESLSYQFHITDIHSESNTFTFKHVIHTR